MNSLAKIKHCNIKVVDYYILLDHLYIYYYYFILAYYYPIPALKKGSIYHRHDVAKTSARYRQDITITRRRIAEGSPTVADYKSRLYR